MAESDHRRRGSRYRARRRAVSLLFEAEMRDVDPVELALERQEMGRDSQEFHDVAPYTVDLVTGVAERLDRVDAMIVDHLQGWTLPRLPAVDRAILRTGVWELLYSTEVQAATVIDQAVLLTSDLAAPKSVPYVNAVLDRVAALAGQIRAAESALSAADRAAAAATSSGDGSEGPAVGGDTGPGTPSDDPEGLPTPDRSDPSD